jgi:hypothetical protein
MTKDNTPEAAMTKKPCNGAHCKCMSPNCPKKHFGDHNCPYFPIPAPEAESGGDFREKLIDKLDDQRFGDNVVNKKLLYKDIEWIVDELIPVIEAQNQDLYEKLLAEGPQDRIDSNNLAGDPGRWEPTVMGFNEANAQWRKAIAKVLNQDTR